MYIYTYVYLQAYRLLRFLFKPLFTMLCSSLKYGGIFSSKKATKKAFHGGDFWEKFMERATLRDGTNDHIISR